MVTGGADYTIKVWDHATLRVLANLRKHTWGIRSVAFAPDGKLLMTASVDNTICLWDTATWMEVGVLKGHMGGVREAAFSTDGKTLISSSSDEVIKMWNVETRQELFSFKTSPKFPAPILCSPDRSVLAVGTSTRGQDFGDVLLLHAPSFAEIDAKEKAKRAAQIRVPRGD
jgi:WD40 repeat protein